eukprot:143208-Rhodomonas_salina.2
MLLPLSAYSPSMQCPVLTYRTVRAHCAMSGTDVAYAATRSAGSLWFGIAMSARVPYLPTPSLCAVRNITVCDAVSGTDIVHAAYTLAVRQQRMVLRAELVVNVKDAQVSQLSAICLPGVAWLRRSYLRTGFRIASA